MPPTPKTFKMQWHETDLRTVATMAEFFIQKYDAPNANFAKSQANDVRKRCLDKLVDVDSKFVLKMHQIRAQNSDL